MTVKKVFSISRGRAPLLPTAMQKCRLAAHASNPRAVSGFVCREGRYQGGEVLDVVLGLVGGVGDAHVNRLPVAMRVRAPRHCHPKHQLALLGLELLRDGVELGHAVAPVLQLRVRAHVLRLLALLPRRAEESIPPAPSGTLSAQRARRRAKPPARRRKTHKPNSVLYVTSWRWFMERRHDAQP